jgi:hypothetical protein
MTANVLSQNDLDQNLETNQERLGELNVPNPDVESAARIVKEIELRDHVAMNVMVAILRKPDENQQMTPRQIAAQAYSYAEEALIARREIQFKG